MHVMAGPTPDRRPQWTDRSAITVAMAAVAASNPLSSTEPGRPARAMACSSSSQVRTPKPIGVHVRTATSVSPWVAPAQT